jgi:SSS family solute:Na+ symporter
MSGYDYIVVAFYFVFMASLGWVFRHFNKDSSDFFRGGGKMLWWLVGATAFMTQFSAWTFTGAGSKAYIDGTLILILYWGNALGYFMNYLWSAGKFRQMRVVTAMEAVRDRFGKSNEQFFTWMSLPIGIFYAGIWLNAISKFVSVVFGMDLVITILIVGLVVLVMASLGGSWAVVASDFMQVLILMPITIVAAFLAVKAVGGGAFFEGAATFIDKLPANHFDWTKILRPQIVYLWIFAVLLKQFATTNSIGLSYRYLCAKDTFNARRAGLLASILFLVGPVIWFIPPMAAAILYPDLSVIPELQPLGDKISDGAFVAIGLRTLPVGMIGLLVSGIFAATMSSMDSGLNKNAGIFVRNFYLPVLRKKAAEKELLFVGKITTALFGVLVILAALYIENIKDFGLFDVMQLFSSFINLPYAIPLVLALLIKHSPRWAAWSTLLVGFLVSAYVNYFLDPEIIRKLLGMDSPFTGREMKDYLFIASMILNTVICTGWFIGVSRIYGHRNSPEILNKETEFYERMNRPVISDPAKSGKEDKRQLRYLGNLCLIYGGFILLLIFIPNDAAGRLSFVFTGGVIVLIGLLLNHHARRVKNAVN